MDAVRLEKLLTRIDNNIRFWKHQMKDDVLEYLKKHSNEIALEILNNGFYNIPTFFGNIVISKSDLEKFLTKRK